MPRLRPCRIGHHIGSRESRCKGILRAYRHRIDAGRAGNARRCQDERKDGAVKCPAVQRKKVHARSAVTAAALGHGHRNGADTKAQHVAHQQRFGRHQRRVV